MKKQQKYLCLSDRKNQDNNTKNTADRFYSRLRCFDFFMNTKEYTIKKRAKHTSKMSAIIGRGAPDVKYPMSESKKQKRSTQRRAADITAEHKLTMKKISEFFDVVILSISIS